MNLDELSDKQKKEVLISMLSGWRTIKLRNEFQDCLQVIYSKKNGLLLDHFSPRENNTYSQKSISLEEAWSYGLEYDLERLKEHVQKLFE